MFYLETRIEMYLLRAFPMIIKKTPLINWPHFKGLKHLTRGPGTNNNQLGTSKSFIVEVLVKDYESVKYQFKGNCSHLKSF